MDQYCLFAAFARQSLALSSHFLAGWLVDWFCVSVASAAVICQPLSGVCSRFRRRPQAHPPVTELPVERPRTRPSRDEPVRGVAATPRRLHAYRLRLQSVHFDAPRPKPAPQTARHSAIRRDWCRLGRPSLICMLLEITPRAGPPPPPRRCRALQTAAPRRHVSGRPGSLC